ncbi:MAG: ferric reductase-like transmembrane domain-containing protein [Pelolinea sp.]|nr:ferric reductase-like transmembrane domain-containing protein [Pelolinea sp.]
MNKQTIRFFALLFYILLIFLPLIVFFLFPMPPGREFLRDFSVLLGFTGLSMAGMQFIPTARLKVFANVFDLDGIYKVHHLLSILSVALVFAHPVILLLNNPYILLLLNPFSAPWPAQAGLIGLAGLILIAITSVLRKEIKISYDGWHLIHDLLAAVIAVFALIHIIKVNYYTSYPAMKWVWILEAVIWGAMTIYMRVIKPAQIMKKPFTVKQIIEETKDTWTMILKPKGHSGLDFSAGQVAWININSSPYTLNKNPFSISGSAHNKGELRFSIKNLGDFTSTIGKLIGGETVYVDGPYGSFSLDDPKTKSGLALLAGGIGAAPVMSILYTLADQNDNRPVYFFYGNYNEENILFKKELDRLDQCMNLTVIHVLEKPVNPGKYLQGFISRQILDTYLPQNRVDLFYFVCGPLPMIAAMEKHFSALDIPRKQINTEKYKMA